MKKELKFQELDKVVSVINSSTGQELIENFTQESLCKRLIQLNRVQKELAAAEKELRELIDKSNLPFEYESWKISVEETKSYGQDVGAIEKELPRDVFIKAIKVSKSLLVGDKDEVKRYKAIVDVHSFVESTTEKLVVRAVKE